ncbi:MAG: Hsp20/alpha crystallin family protein [Candidatus Eremiobacteraeota bacterium]|nr:Hsp20/alpha crystallin family protein [Candidatus Eremiobacteraeota bacterium]
MADVANRQNGGSDATQWRSPLGSLLGWDPFRNFYPGVAQIHGLELTRNENGYTLEIPVAGYKPDQIDVTLDQSVLTVSGKSEKRQFTRSLILPDEINPETIGAKVEDGLLTLTLNFHPKAQPKKIAVEYGTRNVTH